MLAKPTNREFLLLGTKTMLNPEEAGLSEQNAKIMKKFHFLPIEVRSMLSSSKPMATIITISFRDSLHP